MNEFDFAFRIRQALNEGADKISYKATLRLEKARQEALAVARARAGAALARPATVHLPALQLAVAGGAPVDAPGNGGGFWAWLRGAGLAAPVLTLAIGFVAIYEWHNRLLIEELADVDFAVLLDEAPLDAYADQGFGAMLRQRSASVVGPEVSGGDAVADPAVADPAMVEPAQASESGEPAASATTEPAAASAPGGESSNNTDAAAAGSVKP